MIYSEGLRDTLYMMAPCMDPSAAGLKHVCPVIYPPDIKFFLRALVVKKLYILPSTLT
jgi:hypothetical protein